MNDEHDPILDTYLEEVLGGRQAPNLKKRILQRYWEDRNGQRASPLTPSPRTKNTLPPRIKTARPKPRTPISAS